MPTVTFNYNLPEEQAEFEISSQAGKLYSILCDLDSWLREQVKYNDELHPAAALKAFADTRDRLHDLLNEEGVDLYS